MGRGAVPALVPRGERGGQPGGLDRIVVPLDGSERSGAIRPVVQRLAGPFDLRIELVRAIELLPGSAAIELTISRTEAMLEMEEADAWSYLRKAGAPLEGKGLRVTASAERGMAVDVILRRVEATGAGLIAMSTHGRAGMSRLLLGSVAERVLRASPVPVLLWKAPTDTATPRPGA